MIRLLPQLKTDDRFTPLERSSEYHTPAVTRPDTYGHARGSSTSNQLQRLEARMAVLADDDVVVHRNAERARHLDDGLRHLDVGARRGRIAGGGVVQHHRRN